LGITVTDLFQSGLNVAYICFFQMSYLSDHEKLDKIMSDCGSDDDDFILVYAGLELMDDNYDSRANKARTMLVMLGIV
jgi:hypothetical protein